MTLLIITQIYYGILKTRNKIWKIFGFPEVVGKSSKVVEKRNSQIT